MSKNLPPFKTAPQTEIPRIVLRDFLQKIKKECGLAEHRIFGSGKHLVIVLPDAKDEIYTYFKVGKGRRAVNVDEQKAKLYGHLFIDEHGRYVFVITRAAYIYPAERRGTYVATSGRNEEDFMEHRLRLEQSIVNKNEARFNKSRDGNVIDFGVLLLRQSQVEGNIHTHPGFGCTPSSIDRAANESTEAKPYAYLICDPIREDFSAMVGVRGEPAKIVFFEELSGAEGEGSSIARVASVCRSFLKKPGVRGRFRMFYDANGKAHVKFQARFVCSGDAADEFELAKKDDAR